MDRETIIKLAREAGLIYWHPKPSSVIQKQAAGVWWIDAGEPGDELEYFAKLVAEHEREACAQLCEAQENRVVQTHPARLEFDPNSMMARKCAAVIRARGNT